MGRGTLGRRLVWQVVALVALVAVALSAVTTVAVRQLTLGQLDAQIVDAANRIPGMGGPGGGNAPRQQVGTLIVGLPKDSPGFGLVLGEQTETRKLEPTAVGQVDRALHGQSRTVVSLAGVGRYRLLARTVSDGVLVVGLPMVPVDRVVARLIALEAILAGIAMLLAAVAARTLVGRSLRPLNRVAATAQQVSRLPLDRGEVALAVRVPAADTDPTSEVGRVGQAFNHMLSNVEEALAARQASEVKVRQFVADASHELRNPLAAIRGYAELTRRERASMSGDAAYALERVEAEAERMSYLVEDLLLLARLDSGPDLDVRPVDLTEVVLNAVSDARAAGPDHVWQVELPDEPVQALGDPHRLHQVVANLLANARTHTPPGTAVHAAVSVSGPLALLTVTDHGPGIPDSIRDQVFERFTRAEASRVRSAGTSMGRSTGLGLAIVAAVVEAHRGTVAVQSRPGWTQFQVSLPLAPVPPAPAQVAVEPS